MKLKFFLLFVALLVLMVGIAAAEDGALFRRNISKTPDQETEKAAIYMMDFYVPAQSSTGVVGPVEYYTFTQDITTTIIYSDRHYAKPLAAVYIDEIDHNEGEGVGGSIDGGLIPGEFDGFAAVSLDDGTSWKRTNLSRSADLSSFTLANGQPYPGGVPNIVHQVAGEYIFVAWISKYCDGGTPLYKLDDDVYMHVLTDTYGLDTLYLYDLFGVKGNQGSVDYTAQGFPEVGEIPYSCVWTARGKLVPYDDPSTGDGDGGDDDVVEATHVIWTKPERLTSGARDANLPAVDCAKGAGCILTWQEDPLGLRPGQGLGPGEGWSGAIANGKTDIWYSYISWEGLDTVRVEDETDGTFVEIITFTTYIEDPDLYDGDSTMPKVGVPMAMPVRLTDNNMCKSANSDPYCYIDFADIENLDPAALPTEPTPDSTYCASVIPWLTPGGSTVDVCVAKDGRVLNGRVASTRVRLNLKPYTKTDGTISAWVIMAAEETKALGDVLVDPYGNPAENPLDIGKDIWYYSFDMFDHPVVDQGGMLNQPAVCSPWTIYEDPPPTECTPYEFFPVQEAKVITKTGEITGTYVIGDFYLTEIARRFALTTNSVSAAMDSESGLSAILIYKQGIINQGGPADIMLRRVLLPDDFDPAVNNPYAYENMECGDQTYDEEGKQTGGWAYDDGSNPNYLKGLCLDPAINISGSTIYSCYDEGGQKVTGNDACAALFPVADDGSIPDPVEKFPKVNEWRQCDGTVDIEGCNDAYPDITDGSRNNLEDQVWANPFDVAKGHRGFLDGDFVMMMYAWAPNWKANAVGNDHYNLYIRRSFNGGDTWTTTPAVLGGTGITVTEYYYGATMSDTIAFEWTYDADAFEQARNVSQLVGNKITILDPRYSPTGGLKLYPNIHTDWLDDNKPLLPEDLPEWDTLPYEDDAERDPSKYFIVFETGDNTTVAEGEAVPLDLYYSRATVYGDDYEVVEYAPPGDDGDEKESFEYWPWLENKADDLSGEASMLANPGGTFMYAVWNQWKEEIDDDGHELIYDSDIIFRRLLYVPDGTVLSPKATVLYYWPRAAGYNIGGDATFVGSLRTYGGATPVAYQWRSSLDGILSTEKSFSIPVTDLSLGLHTIYFTGQDSNENWAPEKSIRLLVALDLQELYTPVIVR